jgi:hypothetical protein
MDAYTLAWVGGFVAVFLLGKLLTRQSPVPTGTMRYSRAARLLFPVVGIGSLVALAAALVINKKMPVEKVVDLWPMAAFVLGICAPFVLEFQRVRHRFDDEKLEYSTPWSRTRSLRWAEVKKLRWRQSYQWFDVIDASGRVFHFSTMLLGRKRFAVTALRKIPAEVLSAHAPEKSVLENMAASDGGLVAPDNGGQ